MKKQIMLALILALATAGTSAAQISTEAALTIDAILENEDKIFFDSLDLTPEQAKAFRPVYEEFKAESDTIMTNRISLIRGFMENSGKLSNAQARETISQHFTIRTMDLELQKKYAQKFLEILPPTKVARFFQINNKIDALVDVKLAESLPLIQ
ncbi:MAG: hypothetical protein GY906_38885 [bacterium]|nr:hypothetical protein [bacterium]